MNLQQNNSLIHKSDVITLSLLCKKSEVILLVLVGLTAGRPAVRRNIGRYEKFLKLSTDCIIRILTKVQCYYSINAFHSIFWVKYIVRCVMEMHGDAVFFHVDPYY